MSHYKDWFTVQTYTSKGKKIVKRLELYTPDMELAMERFKKLTAKKSKRVRVIELLEGSEAIDLCIKTAHS